MSLAWKVWIGGLTACPVIAAYLWTIPAQRASWQRVAAEQGGQGRYRDFCSLLVNDINFLMDAAIEHLKEARKLEGQKEDTAAWEALNAEERADASDNLEAACEAMLHPCFSAHSCSIPQSQTPASD